jgi:hypothetical protein
MKVRQLVSSSRRQTETGKVTGHSRREMFLRHDTVDAEDTWKAVDQMEGSLKSVDQNGDQVPLKQKEG